MNNTFSFRRFGSYFAYDIRRWASSYGPTLLVMSFFPVILYTLILVYSLLFRQMWCAPSETTRIIVGCIVSAVLSLTYPASVYGFVTDKRAGSAFLMLPASRLEKFLSMILNTVVVVPMIFSALYIASDAVICLIDKSCGATLFSSALDGLRALASFAFASDAPIHVSLFSLYSNVAGFTLYFLLGALLFKKHKILYPILIMIGLQMLLSMVVGIVVASGFFDSEFASRLVDMARDMALDADTLSWAIALYNILATLWDILLLAAFGGAVYIRLKTLKH